MRKKFNFNSETTLFYLLQKKKKTESADIKEDELLGEILVSYQAFKLYNLTRERAT